MTKKVLNFNLTIESIDYLRKRYNNMSALIDGLLIEHMIKLKERKVEKFEAEAEWMNKISFETYKTIRNRRNMMKRLHERFGNFNDSNFIQFLNIKFKT